MGSKRQKTFKPPGIVTFLSAFFLILLLYPALSTAAQFKVIHVTDGDIIKVNNNGKSITIHLVEIDTPETSKKK